jgi:predicted dehydrogenase
LRERFGDRSEIVALSDSDPTRLAFAAKTLSVETTYSNTSALIQDPNVDVVVITTPDFTHASIALEAINAGKHIICEKPLATTIEDCNKVLAAGRGSDRLFMVGFVLRYTALFAELHKAVSSGEIGTPSFLTAVDNRIGGSYFRRWHRLRRNSGGLLVHKSCHAFDAINWIFDRRPTAVAATGGIAVYSPKDWAGERCLTCDVKSTCPEYTDITAGDFAHLYYEAEATSGYIADTCVYNSEKDTVDHAAAYVEYEGGPRASYSLCLFASYTGREFGVWGETGKLEGSDANDALRLTRSAHESVQTRTIERREGGHGGGDVGLLEDCFNALDGGQDPAAGLEAGYRAAVLGIAAEESVARGGERLTLAELGASS